MENPTGTMILEFEHRQICCPGVKEGDAAALAAVVGKRAIRHVFNSTHPGWIAVQCRNLIAVTWSLA